MLTLFFCEKTLVWNNVFGLVLRLENRNRMEYGAV